MNEVTYSGTVRSESGERVITLQLSEGLSGGRLEVQAVESEVVTISIVKEAGVDRDVEAVAGGRAHAVAVLSSAVANRHRVAITTGRSQWDEHGGQDE